MNNTLLRIDASSRHDGSVSRNIGDELVHALTQQPNVSVIHRDLANESVEHIRNQTIVGFYTPEDQLNDELRSALALSDQLINDLLQADTLIITTPMYNYSVPSVLKAWMDQVARMGKTFSFDGNKLVGLLKGKRAYIVVSYGLPGYVDGGASSSVDFVQPHLRAFLALLGIEDVNFITLEGTSVGEELLSAQTEKARNSIRRLVDAQ
jgi:FMN-dependent NADH-azoreductase